MKKLQGFYHAERLPVCLPLRPVVLTHQVIEMPDLTATYTSPASEYNLSANHSIEFNDNRANNIKNLTAQILSLKAQLNDHFTKEMAASGDQATNGKPEDADEEGEEEDDEEDSSEVDGGMVKVTEAGNDRAKRPKTN